MAKAVKTNAMRMLDKAKIAYTLEEYDYNDDHLTGIDPLKNSVLTMKQIYKTIVLKGNKTGYLVCCLNIDDEIDLKKLAKASGNKSVEPCHMKDLLSITGYIRGGCSPIGMKKKYDTYIDDTVNDLDIISFSAGKRGMRLIIDRDEAIKFINMHVVNIRKDI